MKSEHLARRGFSLIELLVVIAIIAVLAAILFPVFATMREKTRQTTCMSQLHQIYEDVQLYKTDNNKYPPVLYGYVEFQGAQPKPMDQITGRPLFAAGQKYLKDRSVFFCPDNTPAPSPTAITNAVYPPTAGPALANQPVMLGGMPANFYRADSYDVGPQLDTNGNVVMSGGQPVMELHYSLDWTGPAATGPADATNQLKYKDPDASTVLTWCPYHVAVAHANVIPVVLLSGTVKPAQTNQFISQGPLKFKF